ncbi:MAG: lycopene cyclase domain-containing protein [Bacteroidetes bacterium]|nr:lycopene cyclase domain-containing protein [Bacteroidota bacterium]
MPYSCIFIYEALNYYIKKEFHSPILSIGFTLTGLLFFALSFFYWGQAYTWSVLFLSGFVLPLLPRVLSPRQLSLFSLASLISLLPMFIVNGLLTALPVVIYNDSHNLGLRIGSIPVEDFLYFLLLYALNIGIYERLRK